MDFIRTLGGQMFASLSIRNYRLYFIGIGFSHIGTWMQIVALGWLVLELTGSGTALGTVLAFRFAPLFFGALFAGSLVDSFDKRHLLYATQAISASIALSLGALVHFELVALWMVYVAAVFFGLADVVDRPARQTFVHEMVGPENLRNAVALNSTEANLARALGPLFAGALIASVGMVLCFLANAFSYIVFIIFLALMRREDLRAEAHTGENTGMLAGLRYAFSVPLIWTLLVSMAIIGTLTYEFQTSLPLLARITFLGGAADYAALLSAMGVGSVVGGLFSAGRRVVGVHEFVLWAFLFGLSLCATAFMPSLFLAIIGMGFVGFFSICLSSTGNTMLQLESVSHMRGRIMSLWTMALFGSTLIGAPIIGFIGEHASPRWALATGGIAALFAALYANRRLLEGYRLFQIPAFISVRRETVDAEDVKV